MQIGSFNISDYLKKLNEESADKIKIEGGVKSDPKEGLIIPEENKKVYDWLKKEYDKAKIEVKVEIKVGGAKFEPGYELQTKLDSVKDFKPGMYGEIKTSDTAGGKKEKDKEPKKDAVVKKTEEKTEPQKKEKENSVIKIKTKKKEE